jgi:hypothetical protein
MPQGRDVNFSTREIQLILESLLYCASTDLNHTLYHEDLVDVSKLAIKLRLLHQDIPIDNVFIIKDNITSSGYTQELLKYFPELIEN